MNKPLLKPLLKLITSKAYTVRRIGPSTEKVTKGLTYTVKFINVYQDNWDWIIEKTDHSGIITQPVLREGSDIWKVLRSVDGKHIINGLPQAPLPEPEEKIMSEEARTKLNSTGTGRLINNRAADKVNDREIIAFMDDIRRDRESLAGSMPKTSKYFVAKDKEWKANEKILTAELESRV